MKYERNAHSDPARLNLVGGQAVLEGVMMKAGERTVTSCRREDGSIVVTDDTFLSVRKKHKWLNIPILRGVVNFVEMLRLSIRTLGASADALGLEEEDSRAQRWMKKHLGIGLTDLIMMIGTVLGVALSLFLFLFLPATVSNAVFGGLEGVWSEGRLSVVKGLVEGTLKVIIFLAYLILVSLLPDIRRTFMYHGAEHKSIACFESGAELTPQNAKRYTRFHPRCGTSFMFFMILLGVIAGIFIRLIVPGLPNLAYVGIRLLILPLLMGLGYEVIMLAGKHDNPLTRILSAPGLWVQRITTREPTEDMLEVAILSLKLALRDRFPEFMDCYLAREWEHNDTDASRSADASAQTPAPDGEAGEIADEVTDAPADGEVSA